MNRGHEMACHELVVRFTPNVANAANRRHAAVGTLAGGDFGALLASTSCPARPEGGTSESIDQYQAIGTKNSAVARPYCHLMCRRPVAGHAVVPVRRGSMCPA
jgi:hypothetical protein